MSYEYARGTVPTVGYVETERLNDFFDCFSLYMRRGCVREDLPPSAREGRTHAVGGPGPPGCNPGAGR